MFYPLAIPMTPDKRQLKWQLTLAFGLVYLFWGSTYLGIRIAVEQIPPALMCGVRFLIAGSLMLVYCWLSGRTVRYRPVQLAHMAIVGLLLLMGGNLTLSYAELVVPSGLAALLVSMTPLWFLVLDSLLLGDHHISTRGLVGLGLGVVGMVVLLWPDLRATGALGHKQLMASLTLPLGSFSWALGSVLSKRWQSGEDKFTSTGWQMVFAGIGNLLLAILLGNLSQVQWTTRGLAATLYLVVFGSWVGYTAYIWLLGHAPTSKVSTYAYVNPVVAVFLGWLIEGERVDHFILMGSVIVIASVILVTSAKTHAKPVVDDLPAVETPAD
jgi:drug/metabolite transporter (DMT)-like permease